MTAGRPGRRCSVCHHAHRAAIDAALLAGQLQHLIAAEHGISADALSRHRLRHLPAVAVEESASMSRGSEVGPVDLLAGVVDLRTKLLRILARAEAKRDPRTALLAIKEAIRLLEFHGRLTGELAADGTRIAIQVNMAGTAGMEAARARILGKLAAIAGSQPAVDADTTA